MRPDWERDPASAGRSLRSELALLASSCAPASLAFCALDPLESSLAQALPSSSRTQTEAAGLYLKQCIILTSAAEPRTSSALGATLNVTHAPIARGTGHKKCAARSGREV